MMGGLGGGRPSRPPPERPDGASLLRLHLRAELLAGGPLAPLIADHHSRPSALAVRDSWFEDELRDSPIPRPAGRSQIRSGELLGARGSLEPQGWGRNCGA
jgi:hypothetical protein